MPPVIENESKIETKQPELIPADLSDEERKIYKLLSFNEAKHIDLLSEKSSLKVSILMSVLLALDMRDLIRELPGKHFVKKI